MKLLIVNETGYLTKNKLIKKQISTAGPDWLPKLGQSTTENVLPTFLL